LMWRSLLFVPVLEERFIAKAANSGADAVVLDLEASIADARKADARAALPEAAARLASEIDVTVRINPLWLEAIRDLEACMCEGISAIHLARCNGPEEVIAVDRLITELERDRGLNGPTPSLIAMLESPAAVENAQAIAQASPRMAGLTLGVEDYATEMGVAANDTLLRTAAFQVIQTAKAARLEPILVPTSMADFRNLEALEDAAQFSRNLGATGGYAVHPAQIEVLNRVFAPTETERDWARQVLATSESAKKDGKAVFLLDGKMIDLPLITRAQKILKRQ
jgi:citrate lyase subunit beta/citryl-CoA lyase